MQAPCIIPNIPRSCPDAFHILAKPRGALCNLACKYCFYSTKTDLYKDGTFRMSEEVLESYLRQVIQGHRASEVTIAWQGGEPTLMGLDFFKRSMDIQRRYARAGQTIVNTIQTNGTLLDDEWCSFFHDHGFLVGISLDGPRELHDRYRVDAGGAPSFDKCMRGVSLLHKYEVEMNVLVTINAANADHPQQVYRFLRDKAGFKFIQFIPVVERDHFKGGAISKVTRESVNPGKYGRFMIGVFDEWIRRDVGNVFVQSFDVALANWYGEPPTICTNAPLCGTALALEHNGDLYSCDHFVDEAHLLGNIIEVPLVEMVGGVKQVAFGMAKGQLPRKCMKCPVRFACHGGCPKDRFMRTTEGESGLNYLCSGYYSFYRHIDQPMRYMSELLRQGRPPSDIMAQRRR
jgi:uncharacterized protein